MSDRKLSKDGPKGAATPIINRPLLPKPEVILLLDSSGVIVQKSGRHAGERLRTLDFAIGKSPHEVLHPGCDGTDCRLSEDWREAWRAHESGLPVEWLFASEAFEARLKMRLQPVSYACSLLFNGLIHNFEDHSLLFVQDVTSDTGVVSSKGGGPPQPFWERRKSIQEQVVRERRLVASLSDRLRTLTGRLLVAQETERKRIASELHDSLGQSLSLILYEIEGCLDDPDNACMLERTLEHTKRALQDLRDITRNLLPTIINELGLAGALEVLCDDFSLMKPDVQVLFKASSGGEAIPNQLAASIYRIAQEALTNVAHHAQATQVSCHFRADNDSIELVITDNGVGIAKDATTGTGLGLITMKERTEALGGAFTRTSKAGQGCTVRAAWQRNALRLVG